jgi:hypothetical protein
LKAETGQDALQVGQKYQKNTVLDDFGTVYMVFGRKRNHLGKIGSAELDLGWVRRAAFLKKNIIKYSNPLRSALGRKKKRWGRRSQMVPGHQSMPVDQQIGPKVKLFLSKVESQKNAYCAILQITKSPA